MNRIAIVNANDEIITYVPRESLDPHQLHRIVAIWITSTSGDILFAQRALTKKSSPGLWSIAAAGTVEEGETYLDCALREVKEELGIEIHELTEGPKRIIGKERPRMCQFYLTTIPIETTLSIQTDEVAEARWFSKQALAEFYAARPDAFTDNTPEWLPEFLEKHA